MNTTILQMQSTQSSTIYTPGENIAFDTTIIRQNNISYNPALKNFLFNATGVYIIQWSVVTATFYNGSRAVLALTSSQGDEMIGNTSEKQGEFSGIGIIYVNSPGVTVSLVNMESSIVMASVPVSANITVYSANITAAPLTLKPTYAFYNAVADTLAASGDYGLTISLWIWYAPHYLRIHGSFETPSEQYTLSEGRFELIGPNAATDIYDIVGIRLAEYVAGQWPIFPDQGPTLTTSMSIRLDSTPTPGVFLWCHQPMTTNSILRYDFDVSIII